MLSIRFLITLIIIAIIVIGVVIFNESLFIQNSDPELNSMSVIEEPTATEEVDPRAPLLSTGETGTVPGDGQLNGPSLLEKHCAACHTVQFIELNRKSSSDWEITLEKMENLGLQLSQEERDILLDYLETR